MSAPPPKLPALTSLRFFAAALVVVYHAQDIFGFHSDRLGIAGMQAVSFFFVLSGFILCHVYPTLDSWPARRRFLLARFARIYPTHLVCLGLALALVPMTRVNLREQPGSLAFCLLLLQSWLPFSKYAWAVNGPAWSISTEAFFYVSFPLLVMNWRRTWLAKVGLSFAFLLVLVYFPSWLGWPLTTNDPNKTSIHMFCYTFPLVRVFEFTLGMAFYRVWQWLAVCRRPSAAFGTALEVTALALVVAGVALTAPLTVRLTHIPWVPMGLILWLWDGGILLPAFGGLILVMALRSGRISALLARPLPHLAGEISFALYLVHLPLLFWCHDHPFWVRWPLWLSLAAYLGSTLVVSYGMWRLVERPCRTLLMGRNASPRPA